MSWRSTKSVTMTPTTMITIEKEESFLSSLETVPGDELAPGLLSSSDPGVHSLNRVVEAPPEVYQEEEDRGQPRKQISCGQKGAGGDPEEADSVPR